MTPQQIAELVKRLQGIRTRVGHMCSHHHPPRMSVPASPDDDDLFIANAADEAAAALTALQERVQELHAGDEQRVRDLTKWIEQAEKAEARIESLERMLAEADAVIPDLALRYRAECRYCLGDKRACRNVPKGGCSLQDARYLRHAARHAGEKP